VVAILILAAAVAVSPPVPKLRYWLTDDDFPRSARGENHQGVVRFALSVDSAGHPTHCRIVASSGFTELDEQTCKILVARVQFEPARDEQGEKAPGVFSTSFRWQLPNNPVARKVTPDVIFNVRSLPNNIQQAVMTVHTIVQKDGHPDNCVVAKGSGIKEIDAIACRSLADRGPLPTGYDAAGAPVRSVQNLTLAFIADTSSK
jgi:TonB family protein